MSVNMARTTPSPPSTPLLLPLNSLFPGEPGSAGPSSGPPPWPVLEENIWGSVEQDLRTRCLHATQPSVSKHWRKHKALTPTCGLTSSFLDLPMDSWQKGALLALWCQYLSNNNNNNDNDVNIYIRYCQHDHSVWESSAGSYDEQRFSSRRSLSLTPSQTNQMRVHWLHMLIIIITVLSRKSILTLPLQAVWKWKDELTQACSPCPSCRSQWLS